MHLSHQQLSVRITLREAKRRYAAVATESTFVKKYGSAAESATALTLLRAGHEEFASPDKINDTDDRGHIMEVKRSTNIRLQASPTGQSAAVALAVHATATYQGSQ